MGQQGQLGPTFGTSASHEVGPFNACTPTTLVSTQFTLTAPGMVYLEPGGSGVYANGASNQVVDYDLELLDSTGTTTLAQLGSATYMDWGNGLLGAPLPDGAIMPQGTGNGSPYIAAAGTYTAALTADVGAGGPCASSVTEIGPTEISVIEIGNTA